MKKERVKRESISISMTSALASKIRDRAHHKRKKLSVYVVSLLENDLEKGE